MVDFNLAEQDGVQDTSVLSVNDFKLIGQSPKIFAIKQT